ncbi:pectin esterase [Xanthomonas vasicola pv. vasculorum NCPPB 895]|nr:pectin esterase [Xanthomonas vasicola pv. vasculorum NCPPB 895]
MALTGTATRQQIISSEASTYTIAKALARAKAGPINALVTDNGNPTAGVALFTADYAVAADGPTRYRSVQSAIDAAVAAGGNTRRYISIKAGTYTELICVPSNAPPLMLSGLGTNTGDTIIRFNNANPTPKPAGTASHPCASNASATTVCTSNSATVTVRAANFEAPHLRVDNNYVEGTYTDNNQSAVALAVRGDKANFQDVLVSSNQDTLVISASSASDVIRAYFKSSTMEAMSISSSAPVRFRWCHHPLHRSTPGQQPRRLYFCGQHAPRQQLRVSGDQRQLRRCLRLSRQQYLSWTCLG